MAKTEKLQRKGKCSSCDGEVVGVAGSESGFCTSCGAKVTGKRGEPADAIKTAVRDALVEFGFKPGEKPAPAPASVPAADEEDFL